jgi:hypothetical protein
MSDDTDVEYVFRDQARGATRGQETGTLRQFRPGRVIRAPEGEFRHLNSDLYETRPVTAEDEEVRFEGGTRYVVGEKTGNGWYPVIDRETGDQVDGESERSKAEAKENADRLNGELDSE